MCYVWQWRKTFKRRSDSGGFV